MKMVNNPSVRLIQLGNNRNYHFRYFLGVRVRLIKVSFKVNKGNRFWDFDYCPLNIEDVRLILCPLIIQVSLYLNLYKSEF